MATKSKASSQVTADHYQIQRWAEERDAKPACVRGTGAKNDIGILRLDFPGFTGEDTLEHIEWEEWFEKFDDRDLALLYQEETAAGEKSNFNKLVSRETTNVKGSGSKRGGAKKGASSKKSAAVKKTAGVKKAAASKKTSAARKSSATKKSSSKKAAAKKAVKKAGKKAATKRR